ncbi:hypothetical protein FRB98_001639 [Tulasnella sp. 332]|nr:hypothetical protein FRB98_001639 [Tulasnella sp. 332]
MSQHLALHTIETRGQGLRGKVPGAMTHRELGSTDHQQTRTRRPSNHTEFDGVEIRRETIVGKDFLEQGQERGVEAADAFEMTPKVSTSSLTSRRRSSLIVEDDEGDDEATSEDMDGGPPSEAHSQLDTRFQFPRRPPPIVRYGRAD